MISHIQKTHSPECHMDELVRLLGYVTRQQSFDMALLKQRENWK